MRLTEWTRQFKRDFKRENKGRYRDQLDHDLFRVIDDLANDQRLAAPYRDHVLTGSWSDHRDCHIKPDLVLIYQKPKSGLLRLVRLGSHSQLGL